MRNVKRIFGSFREATVLLIVLLFGLVMSVLSPYFFRWTNLRTVLIGLSCSAVLAIGTTMILACGAIDISLGAQLALSGAITGVLAINGVNVIIAMIIAIAACMVIGFINGTIVSRTSLNPMISTLAMQYVCTGITNVITKGSPQSMRNSPAFFSFMGKGTVFGFFPMLFLEFLILGIIVDIMMRKSRMVRKVYYVGSNMQAATYSGINAVKVKTLTFVFGSVMAAFAGILTTARLSVASPSAGSDVTMIAMSAAVIGGASPAGGTGTILGTFLALTLLTLVDNALVLLGVNVYWQDFISGMILLSAVLIDYFTHNSRKN